MNYDNILEQLVMIFPNLKGEVADNNYLSELPHCIFDIIVVPYIIKACENGHKITLTKVGDFLEQMALCSDKQVRELLNVSILEPIVLDKRNVVDILQQFLGQKTSEDLNYWKKQYIKS